jgi:hypothetical protein
MHLGCAWTTVGSLGFMKLVLLYGSFGVKYPRMPVDPEGLAGQMYYLCDSEVVDELNASRMNWAEENGGVLCVRKEVDKKEARKKTLYRFGEMVGVSGRVRVGVELVKEKNGNDKRKDFV